MQTVKDTLFDMVEEIEEVRHVAGHIFPVCRTIGKAEFFCTKVEGKAWDYESINTVDIMKAESR